MAPESGAEPTGKPQTQSEAPGAAPARSPEPVPPVVDELGDGAYRVRATTDESGYARALVPVHHERVASVEVEGNPDASAAISWAGAGVAAVELTAGPGVLVSAIVRSRP